MQIKMRLFGVNWNSWLTFIGVNIRDCRMIEYPFYILITLNSSNATTGRKCFANYRFPILLIF
jgi:hypothetical protein